MAYPNSLDSFQRPGATDPLDNPALDTLLDQLMDAIEAVEAKVGITGSGVAGTVDKLINDLKAVGFIVGSSTAQLTSELLLADVILKGNDTAKPGTGPAIGAVYFATDTKKIFRWTGGVWELVGEPGVSGLPSGLLRPQDFTAAVGFLVDPADATTRYFTSGTMQQAPSLDSTQKSPGDPTGPGSLKAGFWSDLATSKFYWRPAAPLSRTQAGVTYNYLTFWTRWVHQDGFAVVAPELNIKIRAASGTVLDGTFVEALYPSVPEGVWRFVILDITAIPTTLFSVGFLQFQAPSAPGGGQPVIVHIDHIQFKAETEVEQALASGTTVGVLVPPSYVPGVAEAGFKNPHLTKTVVDLRPERQYVTGLRGVRDIREFGKLVADGSADMAADLAAIVDIVPDGTTLTLPADAEYRVNSPVPIKDKTNVTIDGQGATLFATVASTNPMLSLARNNGLTIRNLRMFGFREDTRNGSALTQSSGTVVGTTTEFDALDEGGNVAWPNPWPGWHYARDKDGYVEFRFSAKDTNQVANDLVVIFKSGHGSGATGSSRIFRTEPFTLTASQATYTIRWRISERDMRERTIIQFRKATGTANTITIYSTTERGRVEYQAAFDAAIGIDIATGSNYLIEDCHIEGMNSDAIQPHGRSGVVPDYPVLHGVVIRNCMLRGNGRHGVSSQHVDELQVENCIIRQTAYDAIDLEAGGMNNIIRNPVIRNITIDGMTAGGILLLGWARIENAVVQNVTGRAVNQYFLSGGSRGGSISNCKNYSGDVSPGVALQGRDMSISDIDVVGYFRNLAETGQTYVDDFGVEQTVAAGNNTVSGVRVRSPAANPLQITAPNSRISDVTVDTATPTIHLLTSDTVKVLWGTGTPEGVVAAGVGSLFLRTDGGAGTTLYIKETGTGTTGWVAK